MTNNLFVCVLQMEQQIKALPTELKLYILEYLKYPEQKLKHDKVIHNLKMICLQFDIIRQNYYPQVIFHKIGIKPVRNVGRLFFTPVYNIEIIQLN